MRIVNAIRTFICTYTYIFVCVAVSSKQFWIRENIWYTRIRIYGIYIYVRIYILLAWWIQTTVLEG